MTALEHFRAGNLGAAIQALTDELRSNPGDERRRTFLFELLCFAGQFDRAERQLEALSQSDKKAQLGALVYRAALQGERDRHDFFQKNEYASQAAAPEPKAGTFNGKPFTSIADADRRIGARLEVFTGGSYMWVPFAHIVSLKMQPPAQLRDLMWAPVLLRTSDDFPVRDLGEVLAPVQSPFSFQSEDDAVKLGRATVWEADEEGNEVPFGQKMLLIDGEEVPFLELREVAFTTSAAATA